MNYKQVIAIKNSHKKRLLKLNPALNEESGIYIFTRIEDDRKYAYVGQAKHILSRLAEHLMGYEQWIDKSLKLHKLGSDDNPTGWYVEARNCPIEEMNELETYWVDEMLNNGYEMRNKTGGSQGKGKVAIEPVIRKGYNKGLENGYSKCCKELKAIADKYLIISTKKNNKLSQRMLQKFNNIINGIN